MGVDQQIHDAWDDQVGHHEEDLMICHMGTVSRGHGRPKVDILLVQSKTFSTILRQNHKEGI